MSNPQTTSTDAPDGLTASESILGKALVLIHRAIPFMQKRESAGDVQKALRNIAALIDSARQTHAAEQGIGAASANAADLVEAEMVAIVAAAVAALIDRPHRVVSVVPADTTVPHLNVWAFEGRSQLLVSHKVR